jgi:hypothetical protein
LSLNRVEVGCFLDGVEMDDGRFLLQSTQDDEIDDARIVSFTGTSLLKMTEGAIVYSADGSVTLGVDQTYAAVTAGQILRALFQQNSTRGGVMSVLTWASFSNSVDSAGNAWAFTLGTVTYKVGTSYLSVIRNLVDNGMIEVKMVGRDLRVYNAGGLGVDKTIISEPVVLRKGIDFLEAPTTATNEQIASVALIEGDQNVLLQNVDAGLVATWGRIEAYISQGGISDQTTLGDLAAQEITRRSLIRQEKTRKINVLGTLYTPYTHYRVSDYVYSNTTGVNERLRIRQMVISIDVGGIQSASVVLNDKFLEAEIAIARKVTGILGGSSVGGSVAIPTDPGLPYLDVTIPSQVTGLGWTSAAYQTALGETRAQITATWTAVTTNTNATVIDDLDYYEVQFKLNSVADWGMAGITWTGATTAYMTVPANMTIDVRARAVDRNGNRGAFSSTVTGATAADATAPPTPSTPVVTPYLGQLRVFWDGLGSVGQAMPTDFKYCEVHMSTTTGFTPSSSTLVDQMTAKGYAVMTDLTYGTTYYFKFKNVDFSNNASAASAQGSAIPETVTGLDIAALTVDTSNLANLAVTTAKIGLLQVLNAQIGALAVDDAKIGNVNVGKLTAGILAADITVSARIKTSNTGARVELNSAGLQAFNSSSVQTVNIAASTGDVTITGAFKTGLTGARLEMVDTTDRTTIELYGTYAGDPAFMNSPVDGSGSPRIGINTGSFTYAGISTKHRLFMNNAAGIRLESYQTGSSATYGYSLVLTEGTANLDRNPGAGGGFNGGSLQLATNSFELIRFGTTAIIDGGRISSDTNNLFLAAYDVGTLGAQVTLGDDGSIEFTGAFTKSFTASGKSALFTDVWVGPNLSGGGTVSYGVTMGTIPVPFYSIESGSDQGNDRMPVAKSATSFTVQHIASVNISLHYWCVRLF